jgi:histidinol-phosphate aminotransferase
MLFSPVYLKKGGTFMQLSRRGFLRSASIAAAASAVLELPALAAPLQVEAAHRGDISTGAIKLSNNENAYGPAPKSLAAMQMAVAEGNRYPDRYNRQLVDSIAALHKVTSDRVLLGCGSMDILRAATGAFLGPGKALIIPQPTFEAIAEYAKPLGTEIVRIPLDSRYAHDLDAMLDGATRQPSLIYVCNPNNPTATITPRKDLETFIGKLPANAVVFMDEAYHHFSIGSPGYESFLDRPLNDERLIISRTFSKVYGLAGMRIGYAIGSGATLKRLNAFRSIECQNVAGVRAAIAGLEDEDYVRMAIRRNAADREEFFRQAQTRGLKPIESRANFIMMNASRPAPPVIDYFQKQSIIIGRKFPPMDNYVRISLGKPEEMTQFWRVWDQMMRAIPANS